MYRYVKHSKIDFIKWDECIDNSPNGNIYSLSWYLNIVSPGWDSIIKEEGGKYISVFPVTHFRKFKVLRFIREPYFANQLGLVHRNEISQQELFEVIRLLKSEYNYITTFPLNTDNVKYMDENSVAGIDGKLIVTLNPSYQIDLSDDFSTLSKNFTIDRRNNIKRSLKNNLHLVKTQDIETLIKIFQENTASRIFGGVSSYQYDLLRKLYKEASGRGMSEIYSVVNSNNVISSSMFFYYNSSIIKFFNASTRDGRKLNGDSFLMNELLGKFAGQGKTFDFERASLKGINEYKESYGSSLVVYPSISYNNLPEILKTLKKIRYKLLTGKYP